MAARSAAVIAGIAAAAAGGGVKGSAAAESELRRIRADSARLAAKAEGAAQNRAAAADAARGAEDEAARRRKEAGDAMRAARERRRQAEEEERIKAKAAAERQRERVATAAAAAEESRAKLMAAKAKLAEKRAGGRAVQSARHGGYDASRYETDKTPPQKTALPPSPLQGLAVATGAPGTAHRRAPSSCKPVAANPGTVAVARPVSAVGVGVQSRPQSAAERREAARVVDADLVAALPESPGGVGTSSRHVMPIDVVTVDVPEFDEARAMAEIAARHVPPRAPVRNTGTVSNLSVPNLELSVSRSPATPSRSRPRTAAGRGVVDVAKARRDAATASRAAIRLAKYPNPSSSRPASAFVRRTEDIFAGGPRGGGTKVVTERDSPPLASDSRLVPVVSSYAEAHEQKMKATEDQFEGTAAAAIGVARAAAAAVNQFVASTTRTDSFGEMDDGAGMESSGTFSGTFSAEELGRVAAETAAAARAAASIASGSSRSDRSSSFGHTESSPRVHANAAQIPNYHPITDETRTRDGETNGGVPAFVFGNASSRGLSTDTFASDEGTRISPGSVDRGAVARALRATVKALESALGPPDEETDSDSGDEAIDSQLKPFYDDDGGSDAESEPASTPSTPRSGTEYYSGSDSEERFVRVHGASRGERVEELVSEMTATEEAAVAIVGAESFGLLYDFLAKKSEAADDGRLNRPGTPGKVRALSERVCDIIPRDKTEAVTLAYRYMHLVEKLQDLE